MKKRVSLLLAAVFAVSAFIGVSQASAATEFGSECQANESVSGPYSFISISHGPGSPLPAAAPVSGVITSWKTTLKFGEVPPEEAEFIGSLFRQELSVWRPAGGNSYTLVGQSPGGPLNLNGTSTFPARIPVAAGDHLGLGGTSVTLICEETGSAADVSGFAVGVPPVGSTKAFLPEPELQLPVVAKIEPDVDGDGYGDETQDLCPQSAAYQTACPVVTISSKPFVAGKKAVTLYVSTSLSAPVGVTGTVNLGKGKKATLTAVAQTVTPGSLTPFKLTLSKQVTKALAETSTKKSLTLSITASATNVTGAPSTSTSTVKLKGQAKPGQSGKKGSKSSK
jgi:hypothetical protein